MTQKQLGTAVSFIFFVFFLGISKSQSQSCSNHLTQRRVLTTLRVGTFNIQDLSLKSQDSLGTSIQRKNSSSRQRKNIALPHSIKGVLQSILNIDADFLILTEIREGKGKRKRKGVFLEQKLREYYNIYLSPSNGSQNIGLLVRHELGLNVDIKSHTHLKDLNPITGQIEPVFTRDAPLFFISHRTTGDLLFAIYGNSF